MTGGNTGSLDDGPHVMRGVRNGAVWLSATFCMAMLCTTSLGVGGTVASASDEPVSQQQALTSVKTWFADTNRMWTTNDFSTLDKVTTGAGRALYKVNIHSLAQGNASGVNKPFTLTGLSVVVPCQSGSTKTFVAYANTNVFTFGKESTESAMVFEQVGHDWKFADLVSPPTGAAAPKTGAWPKLCTNSKVSEGKLVVPVSSFSSDLVTRLNRFSVTTPPASSTAAPFGPTTWFVGATSVSSTFSTSAAQFAAESDTLTQKFEMSSYPVFSWPMADGNGVWVIAPVTQRDNLGDPAGNTTTTWPGGGSVTSPHPTTVHSQVTSFTPNYAAVDPSTQSGGSVTLDGFYGWRETSKAT